MDRGRHPAHHPVARVGGQPVHLGDLLQEVERPELAAVPDHAFPQHYDGRDQNELNIGAEEGLFPWILGHCPLGFDLLEYRRFLKIHPDIVGDEHQQEREQERERASPSR